MLPVRVLRIVPLLLFALSAVPADAQQTGAITGRVVDSSGGVLPALSPGDYTLKFELSGMQTVTRQAQVQLQADTIVEATLGVSAVTER